MADPRPDPASAPPSPGASGAGERPPREVERAAFRVAQLALDNVVQHAPTSNVRISLAADRDSVALTIADDGPGLTIDEAEPARKGRRGLADMRTEARACAATILLRPGADGIGASVGFTWQA